MIRAENKTTDHNRTVRITGIPDADFPELLVKIGYVDDDRSRCGKAVVLDSIVIPAIIKALNESSITDLSVSEPLES